MEENSTQRHETSNRRSYWISQWQPLLQIFHIDHILHENEGEGLEAMAKQTCPGLEEYSGFFSSSGLFQEDQNQQSKSLSTAQKHSTSWGTFHEGTKLFSTEANIAEQERIQNESGMGGHDSRHHSQSGFRMSAILRMHGPNATTAVLQSSVRKLCPRSGPTMHIPCMQSDFKVQHRVAVWSPWRQTRVHP